ncbi:hypothetical protein CDD80_7143 [Ophiocordyceps camponoti-rufipedis]|uniref:Methyltransferase type 11 domain-containing protein n=1 Tax=Ophiocordyceps camponoti-rufipedis TaxID=2004952 RepID=A0A2C5ZEP8_9HYPO|nr:hypothetical protein CDD80_7143 [Ophiocordyceps camponoti-rufipedis]
MFLQASVANIKTSPAPPPSLVYRPWFLSNLYDFLVLGLSNTFIWKCSTSQVLLPLYSSSMGERHLDVGVGSGYFPATALMDHTINSRCKELTILDLHQAPLQKTRERLTASLPPETILTTVCADATGPLPFPAASFDSATIFYLYQCLRGPPKFKSRIFSSLARYLTADGVLTGSIITGDRKAGWLARIFCKFYNSRGIFCNEGDTATDITEALNESFQEVDVWFTGAVMLFRARRPKRQTVPNHQLH